MGNGTIMIVGMGEVGGKALEILARRPGIGRIVAADLNDVYGRQKANNANFGAQLEGSYPDIDFVKVDLADIDGTARTLADITPSVIFNSTSLQSYWVVELLPKEIHKKFQKIGFGLWLPMHLTLAYKLMQAVKKAGIDTSVVNGSYPDAVNPALARVGMGPAAGIGNLELVVPQLRKVVSEKLKVPMRSVCPLLVMHHYAEYWVVREGHTGGAPYYLKVLVDGNDVTKNLNTDDLLRDVPVSAKRPGRPDGHYMVASSAVQKILALLHDTKEIVHAAGPSGLIGGYPVRLGSNGAELALPKEISFDEALRINIENQRLEGIEEIKEDGTILFMEENCRHMKDLLNYSCRTMAIDECERRAKELSRLYNEFAKKYVN
ncbi:MAG: hypothetical protein LLG06_03595 [Desulfobacteraceae bacterium]|nr:hypothetical protein [Desulfobacteraceae bacterium]